jgi:hypothetical protein
MQQLQVDQQSLWEAYQSSGDSESNAERARQLRALVDPMREPTPDDCTESGGSWGPGWEGRDPEDLRYLQVNCPDEVQRTPEEIDAEVNWSEDYDLEALPGDHQPSFWKELEWQFDDEFERSRRSMKIAYEGQRKVLHESQNEWAREFRPVFQLDLYEQVHEGLVKAQRMRLNSTNGPEYGATAENVMDQYWIFTDDIAMWHERLTSPPMGTDAVEHGVGNAAVQYGVGSAAGGEVGR